jgi:glutathione synthase/RimK-type ligase-like ATP-grasp enzyme
MADILRRIAPRLGAELFVEPEYGFVGWVRIPGGRKTFFWDNKFNLNPLASVKIAQDKGYTSFFLGSMGFRVPREKSFFSTRFQAHIPTPRGVDDAFAFAESLGLPVYLKPCRLSQGELVARVHDREEFHGHASAVFQRSRVMLVQEVCEGGDYRLIVLDGEVICAYRRVPLAVTGDGASTVRDLLAARQAEFDAAGRDTRIPVDDPRIDAALRRAGYHRDGVLPAGASVPLLDVANLSLGGTTEEVTFTLHPTVAALGVEVARAMELRFCGIDLIVGDASLPLADYRILEVNSAPGLDNYLHTGEAQREYVDGLYLRVLAAALEP